MYMDIAFLHLPGPIDSHSLKSRPEFMLNAHLTPAQ